VKKVVNFVLACAAVGFGFLGYVYLTLPDVARLATVNPPTTAFIELRAAEARARGAAPHRVQQWVPYGRIAGSLKRAVLVAEDDAFWQHDGIDVKQIKESIERDIQKGTFSRGGSTITQQLAKNLYLSPSKNPVRKLRELLIARRLEASLTKTRIFEIYLNVIEWGDGIYGAEAAARTYFKKPASALSADEAALLSACIINPRIMNPAHQTPGLVKRQKLILGRMGIVTPPPDVAAPAAEEPPARSEEPAKAGEPPTVEKPAAAGQPARGETTPPEKVIK
jgi:monofunctional biosynthetic peptidoglycan transglycosylase